MDEFRYSKPKCKIYGKEIDGVAYIVRDEDSDGNPIPNAYLILCEDCKKKWDRFDDENIRVKLSSRYREKLMKNHRVEKEGSYDIESKSDDECEEVDKIMYNLAMIELAEKLTSIDWMKLADKYFKKERMK